MAVEAVAALAVGSVYDRAGPAVLLLRAGAGGAGAGPRARLGLVAVLGGVVVVGPRPAASRTRRSRRSSPTWSTRRAARRRTASSQAIQGLLRDRRRRHAPAGSTTARCRPWWPSSPSPRSWRWCCWPNVQAVSTPAPSRMSVPAPSSDPVGHERRVRVVRRSAAARRSRRRRRRRRPPCRRASAPTPMSCAAQGVLELEEPGRRAAPGSTGRRLNRVAATRSRPRSRPAEIVAPERETPGTSASDLDDADHDRVAQRQLALARGPGWPTRSACHITALQHDQRGATTHSERRSPVMTSLSSKPSDADRDACRR